MKKLFILITFISSGFIFAQSERHVMHVFYHMNVMNPAGVISALDKFHASDCGKKFPGDLGLMSETLNGASESTHFIIASYMTREDFQNAGALTQSCPEAATMLGSLMNSASPVSDLAIVPIIEANDWTVDGAFTKYDMRMNLENEEEYAEAWSELMESNVESGSVTSSYGLNRVLYGNDEFTHFVYIGASDFVTLTDGATELTSSKAFEKFSRKVKGMREVLNTSLIIPVKAWPRR